MTIFIASESGDMNSPVTISKDSIDTAQGSALSLEAGDKYPLGDLLSAVMLTSANDAANAIAEHISKDVPTFVNKMNETAAKMQMKDTRFANPTGLFDENQYTTARDISIFVRQALKNANFSHIFSIQVMPWTFKDGKSKILTSPNKLFWSYSGIEGGKTGYNEKDQQSVIATASKDGMRLVCIVLNTPEDALFSDAEALFNYGFTNFRRTKLVQKGDPMKSVKVDEAEVNLISGSDVYYVHPTGVSFIKSFDVSLDLKSPVSTSKLAGNARYTLNDDTIIDVGLYPASEAPPPADDFLTSVKKTLLVHRDILVLLILLAAIEVVLIIKNIFKLIRWIFRKIFKKQKERAE
jgi:D-alanyl-D-alanine carboxypeptidase/D-alanyl-D-alanine carboxypeptidase (penicillin-binding protein 5/6)